MVIDTNVDKCLICRKDRHDGLFTRWRSMFTIQMIDGKEMIRFSICPQCRKIATIDEMWIAIMKQSEDRFVKEEGSGHE